MRLDEAAGAQAVFVQIARAIAEDIRRGRLQAGAALPGSRALARELAVHRNTVIAAYRELLAEGYLEALPGRGTFVARTLPDARPQHFAHGHKGGRPTRPHFELPQRARTVAWFGAIPKGTLALYGGLPDVRLVPAAALARAYRRVLKQPSVLGYGDPRGHERLRSALAAMLAARRGLALGVDDIVITRGSQMALALGARVTLSPGDAVAVEALGYRPAWDALRAVGARLLPLPVDAEGLRVDRLAALCAKQPVRAVYLTPHHQYPSTATLSATRRLELLALAERQKLIVFEDDYDHEFHYEGRPILPLASADRAGSVVYIGTLSKVLAPALRIGFMVAPRELLERVTAERQVLDRQGDHATECALAELFEDGEIQRHLRRARRVYQARRDLFVELLQRRFGARLQFSVPRGGMALWAKVERSCSVGAWLERAGREGVLFHTGKQFDFEDRAIPYARFGFAGLNERELVEAAQRLERGWRSLRR